MLPRQLPREHFRKLWFNWLEDNSELLQHTKSLQDTPNTNLTIVYAIYSHSIVAGGLDVMSYATRLMPGTSATMRELTRPNSS